MKGKRGDLERLTPSEKKWNWKHLGEGIGVYEFIALTRRPYLKNEQT
jgi:hypothetical protein